MRELEPPVDREPVERDSSSAMTSVDEPGEGDTTSAMDLAEGAVESFRTPVPVSRTPGSASGTPRTPRDGLPDYVALITAEIEAIEARRAAAARISEAVSPGTPRPFSAGPSRKRYATA
ncbi:MAG TPA: hypothetical protein VIX62_09200, partial [Actinomycetota bacterium]